MANILDTPIDRLEGIGPQKAELLKKHLQLFNYYDLLHFYPFRYIDRTKFHSIRELHEDLGYVQLKGKIISKNSGGEGRKKRLNAKFSDGSGTIDLIWFQGVTWVNKLVIPGEEYVIFGRVGKFKTFFNIPHPELELLKDYNKSNNKKLVPVYHSSETLKARGLDSKGIAKLTFQVLKILLGQQNILIPEILNEKILNENRLIKRFLAFREVHYPQSWEHLKAAYLRLKFDEFFFTQLPILQYKKTTLELIKGYKFESIGVIFNTFYKNHLPFELTNAQKRVLKEIRYDVAQGKQMNRLLQGDVGSGKTIVALMTMLMAIDNGFQACIMAPTEILANQHFEGISELMKEMPVTVRLLTGSTKKKDRKILHEELLENNQLILIGTHALIEDAVKFKNLGMVIIDEQHRFGVAQRAKLWKKNILPPHVLVMTATPIPRTLSMTLYGDLDVSVIDELPPGRKPIKTSHYFDSRRLEIFGFMKQQIALGRQVYVVYPLIKESEVLDYKNLEDGYESITRAFPMPEYQVSMVHGNMKAEAKDFEMQRFVKGETNIMVATTVIEVGVNVPNASVMIIESAERFGLSQLHQLRGRVGRGADQSYCILVTSFKLSSDGKTRMETMVKTNDGFEIAEVDLRLRGPGDLEGTKQSGLADFKLASITKDANILSLARNTASDLLNEDPNLEKAENQIIKIHLEKIKNRNGNWSRIS